MTNVTALSTWTERKVIADAHEARVRAELEKRGWTVTPYGQGILAAPTQRALKLTDSIMRWDPDLVASQGSTVCLIDAKAAMRRDDAWSYHVSRKAISAHRRMSTERDLPIYYVFHNLGVATPEHVMQWCHISTIGAAGGYLTIPAGLPFPFDDVFGIPPALASSVLDSAA